MLQYDFEQSIGYWLAMASQAYQRAISEEVAPHGITHRQCHVLGWLALEGELSQTELAKRMSIEPPTLVRILDRMERAGWIERDDCCHDRRKKIIRLREEVEPVWAKIVECARKTRARATEGLSGEELESLKAILEKVCANLGATLLVQDGV